MVNSLIGSLFVYKMNVLPKLTKTQYEEIQRLIKRYL